MRLAGGASGCELELSRTESKNNNAGMIHEGLTNANCRAE